MKTKQLFYKIMSALLSDPLNSRICYTALVLAATWLAFIVSQIMISKTATF